MSNEKLIEEAAKAIAALHASSYVDEHDRSTARAALAVFEKALGEATITPTAHEVTSDEREALAKAMCAIETRSKSATLEEVQAGIQRWTRHRHEADRLIEELADYGLSIRRSEVPEPSAEPTCEHGTTLTELCEHVERLVNEEPQGDPSTEEDREEALRREFEYRIRTAVAYGAMKNYREIPSQVRADWIQHEISLAMSWARTRGVPEPSAKHPLCGCPCHTTPSMKHIVPCCVPEPQGEPSDAHLAEIALTFDIDDEGGPGSPLDIFIKGYRTAEPLRDHGGWDMSLQFKPGQGEPSDALPLWERPEVIEAARLAYQEAYEADFDAEDCIALALRAASAVTEQGENRG